MMPKNFTCLIRAVEYPKQSQKEPKKSKRIEGLRTQ